MVNRTLSKLCLGACLYRLGTSLDVKHFDERLEKVLPGRALLTYKGVPPMQQGGRAGEHPVALNLTRVEILLVVEGRPSADNEARVQQRCVLAMQYTMKGAGACAE